MKYIDINNSIEKRLFDNAFQKRMPLYGIFELTPLCNMNCKMCYVRLNKHEMGKVGIHKDIDFWLNQARQIKKEGVLFILLTGGEPLLYPKFKELYIELLKMGMILTINTNGTLIDEEWIDFFKKYRPRRINISLYGSNEEIYETLCGCKGYKKTVESIKLLKENGISVKINSSLTKINYKCQDNILKIASSLDVPIRIDTYMIPSYYEKKLNYDEVRLSSKEAAKSRINVYYHEMGKDLFIKYAQDMINKIESNDEFNYPINVTCFAGRCSFTINWQGKLTSCITLPNPHVNLKNDFIASWNELKRKVDKITINQKCSLCNLRAICNNCASNAFLETGCYDDLPVYLCEYAEYSYFYLKEKLKTLNNR